MFANNEIGFALAKDTDWSTTLDALFPAGLAMRGAEHGIMIDIAHHHIDHLAGHFFWKAAKRSLPFLCSCAMASGAHASAAMKVAVTATFKTAGSFD